MGNVAQDSQHGLGQLIREFRQRSGMTQQETADLAGLSVASLRDVEQGRVTRPRPATLQRLGETLGLSSAELHTLRHFATNTPAISSRVNVLGPLRLLVNDKAVDLGSSPQRTILGLLALAPNSNVSRDEIIDVLWGEQPPPGAVELLQSHISRLRQRLRATADEPTPIHIEGSSGGYRLGVTTDQHDMLAIQHILGQARTLRDAGETAAASKQFAAATALWHGEPLSDIPALAQHPTITAWRAQWRLAVLEYAEVTADLGQYAEAIPLLHRLITMDPLDEGAHAALLVALAGSGQQGAAVSHYDTVRRRLADELGADPSVELVDTYQRILRQEVARSEAAPVSAHRQLPPDISDFTGRTDHINALLENMRPAADDNTAVVICSVEGMGGVGKTRLAVHVAHRLLAAGWYADQQLYVDLLGHADVPPADPNAVLASFLRLLGVPAGQIPDRMEERAALYRDRLYNKRALVLLDNAATEDQVTPLLPAGPGNVVLITSRHTLSLDGAQALPLDVFTATEAHDLLVRVVGRQRVAAEPRAAARVVELCGSLPLGVALAARRLRSRKAWRFSDLANRLAETSDRLGELAAGNRRLQAVFELSYQALTAEEQRFFRLLGLHPGEHFTAAPAAALVQRSLAQTRQLLDRLADEHLVFVVSGDRYRFHDLLRAYAQQVARAEPPAEQTAAIDALLDYYLHTTAHAADLLQPHRWGPPLIGTPPVAPTRFAARNEASRWVEAERANITAAIRYAAEHERPQHAWQLAHAMWVPLYLEGNMSDWEHNHRIALAAAINAGDRMGEAVTRLYLGASLVERDSEQSRAHFHRALELHREAGDRVLEINTLGTLGTLERKVGRFTEALRCNQEAMRLIADDDVYRQGVLTTNMAISLNVLGDHQAALERAQQGLVRSRKAGDVLGESCALSEIGDAYRGLGRYDEAIAELNHALQVGQAWAPQRAYAKRRLGNTYRELGQYDAALAELTEVNELVETASGLVSKSEALVDLGALRYTMGELPLATELLSAALKAAESADEQYQQARAHQLLAEVYQARDDLANANDHRHQAGAIISSLGLPVADQEG